MQIFSKHEDILIDGNSVVALGNFDGIHIGHRTILEDAVRIARERGVSAVCYTFSNHPVNFFMKRAGRESECIKLICTEDDKLVMLEELGFDAVANIPFDETTMSMRASSFIHDILNKRLNAVCVCCGFNYTFGVKAEGNIDYLRSECSKLGIDVSIHNAVKIGNTVVSSTEVRGQIARGEMDVCKEFLGRAYALKGIITHGERLGTRIGFPTMNFDAPTTMALPPNGVYFTRVIIEGEAYPAITNIGIKPTVGGRFKTIETNVFEYNMDTYGKTVSVEFLKFCRPEKKFDSVEELRKTIADNVQSAIDYHRGILL